MGKTLHEIRRTGPEIGDRGKNRVANSNRSASRLARLVALVDARSDVGIRVVERQDRLKWRLCKQIVSIAAGNAALQNN